MRPIEKRATITDDEGEEWWVQILGPSDRPDQPQRRSVLLYPLDGWPAGDEVQFDRNELIAALGLEQAATEAEETP